MKVLTPVIDLAKLMRQHDIGAIPKKPLRKGRGTSAKSRRTASKTGRRSTGSSR
jgi:hypothetical protein